jgi:K+-sensing histidine kinase KdpD
MTDAETKKSVAYFLKATILATIIVAILGYLDFKTGEISLDILYLLCICLVSWYTNTLLGMLCVFEIFLAKTSADYFCQIKVGTHLYEWNALNDVLMFIVVCILVGKLKKVLTA